MSFMQSWSISPQKVFLSNKEILLSIPETQRRIDVKDQNFSVKLCKKKTLWVYWEVIDNALTFKIKFDERALTKREIRPVISLIYDPLGFIPPVILEGTILENFCKQNVQWDAQFFNDVQ